MRLHEDHSACGTNKNISDRYLGQQQENKFYKDIYRSEECLSVEINNAKPAMGSKVPERTLCKGGN